MTPALRLCLRRCADAGSAFLYSGPEQRELERMRLIVCRPTNNNLRLCALTKAGKAAARKISGEVVER